jgi:DNA repair exonuclease SbcCD nuclease subunit
MNIKTIPCSLQNVDTIYQVGDIHIRNLKRHAEYKLVFNRLYKEIKKDTKNAMIVVTGDIVHSKLELSPESVNLAQSFFRHLADIAPTVVITGNHDCNLNNAARLDAIYPIVRALNHPNLFYLKDSGVYSISNLHFTVMSVFDRPVDYIKASDFDAPYKIALHHGAVDSALTDFGFKLTNKHVSAAMFDGYDLTLLGDIHKLQYLNVDKTIAYPGSLIQQNFGEGLSHGMLKWDVKSKKSEFIEIPNDYGYYTLEINNGVIPELTDISRNPRIRLKIQNIN